MSYCTKDLRKDASPDKSWPRKGAEELSPIHVSQNVTNISPTHRAFFQAFSPQNNSVQSSVSTQQSNASSYFYKNDHQCPPLPPSKPGTKFNENYSDFGFYQTQNQPPPVHHNHLHLNANSQYNHKNEYYDYPQYPLRKQNEKIVSKNYQHLYPRSSAHSNLLPFDGKMNHQQKLPEKQCESGNFDETEARTIQSSKSHNYETFHHHKYPTTKNECEKYEPKNNQLSYSYNNSQKIVPKLINDKITPSNYCQKPQKMLNNFSHELQNSIKPNQQQFGEVDNYQSYSTFQQYPTTPLPTAISSKHSSAIPPIPPVRTSSLKQQSIQHQNRSKTSSDYSVETRQATFENPSFCSNNENSQKTSKNIVVSDSIDSGGAPSNAKYNFKQQIIKDKNLPIENQLEPNDPPAFHKYFRIYPAINLHKNSYHSKISNLDKNGNEKNFNSTTSFSGKRPQRGGFSCTVNDQIKHYPSPKNGRNYLQSKNNQQLDACSKKSESRSQIISSPEEIGNIIIKNDNAEIKIMGGKVLSQYESWKEMNLNQKLLKNIEQLNIQQPSLSPQKFVIPYIRNCYNVKCQNDENVSNMAAISYLIPLVDNLIKEKESQAFSTNGPVCLIISPTRQLTQEIYEQAKKFAYGTDITVGYCYGENNIAQNLAQLRSGCNILCACVGRLMNLVENGNISVDNIRYLVINQMDKFYGSKYDMEFGILKLLNYPLLPSKENRNTIVFGATLRDPAIEKFVDEHVHAEKQVFITVKSQAPVTIQTDDDNDTSDSNNTSFFSCDS